MKLSLIVASCAALLVSSPLFSQVAEGALQKAQVEALHQEYLDLLISEHDHRSDEEQQDTQQRRADIMASLVADMHEDADRAIQHQSLDMANEDENIYIN